MTNPAAATAEEPIPKEEGPPSIVIQATDIMCGRGGAANKHNAHFRGLVDQYKPGYLKAKKNEKREIAKGIVEHIHRQGGRFLKKMDENAPGGGYWVELDITRSIEKTLQALREGLEVRKGAEDEDNPVKRKGTKDPSLLQQQQVLPASSSPSKKVKQATETGNLLYPTPHTTNPYNAAAHPYVYPSSPYGTYPPPPHAHYYSPYPPPPYHGHYPPPPYPYPYGGPRLDYVEPPRNNITNDPSTTETKPIPPVKLQEKTKTEEVGESANETVPSSAAVTSELTTKEVLSKET